MLIRREPHHVIVRYGVTEWGCTERAVEKYIRKAKDEIAKEQERFRQINYKEEMERQMLSLDYVFRQAARDRNWFACLSAIKEQNAILGLYPTKIPTLEAIKVLVDDNALPIEVLQEISSGLNDFQETAIASFKKIRQSPEPEEE
jgi:hypothetical protein